MMVAWQSLAWTLAVMSVAAVVWTAISTIRSRGGYSCDDCLYCKRLASMSEARWCYRKGTPIPLWRTCFAWRSRKLGKHG